MITNNLSWQEIKPQGETFSPRFGHSLTCFDHNLYIYGGIDTISKKDDFYRIKGFNLGFINKIMGFNN